MKTFLFTLLLVLSAAAASSAATVYLKEGGRLEGTVVRATGREVVLDTAQGRVSIDMAKVERIDYQKIAPPAAPPAVETRPPAYQPERRRRWDPLSEPRTQSLSLDFGLAAPLSSIDFSAIGGGGSANNGDVGPLIGFQYLYFTSPRVGWGLEFDYYDRSTTDSSGLVPNSFSRVFGDSVLLLGDVKYSLTDQGPVRPYVLLGAGAHRTTTTVDARPNDGFVWSDTLTNERRRLVDGSAWGAAFSARLGLDFGFADPGVFALEAGWTGLTNAGYQTTAQGRALGLADKPGTLNFFTLAGRWGWSF
jgi:opacity protein-like surface antigen